MIRHLFKKKKKKKASLSRKTIFLKLFSPLNMITHFLFIKKNKINKHYVLKLVKNKNFQVKFLHFQTFLKKQHTYRNEYRKNLAMSSAYISNLSKKRHTYINDYRKNLAMSSAYISKYKLDEP
jgi:hypothetical protein